MKFIMKHFPFLFVILLFYSCNKEIEVDNYKKLYSKAVNFEDNNNIDSAYFYYHQARLSCKPHEVNRIIYTLLIISQLQERQGDFTASEETVTEALKYSKDCDSISYVYSIYNCLGINYEQQKNYESSIEYYNKALGLTNNPLDKIIIKNNIAVISLEEKKYDEAIQKFSKLLNESVLKTYKGYYAKIMDNLGYAYFKSGSKDLAYNHLIKSLKIRDSIGDDYEKTPSFMHLARFYQDSNIDLTYEYAKKAYEAASNVNNPDDRLEALDILILNSSNEKEFKSYYKQFYLLKDSIDFVRQTAKNQFAKIKYESSNAIKDAENERSQKIIYLLLFVVSVLSGVFIFYFIRKMNKEKIQKTAYETETRISKRLHDELANDVFNTMMYLETQDFVEQTRKEKVLGNLENIYEKARNISKQTSGVKTGKDFGETIKEMLLSYKSDRVNIIKKGNNTIKWETVAIEKQIEIHRVLQEVLVNMKKHSEATLVVIVFETLEKSIRIKYSDNGIGFDMEKISKNGVRNMENRMQSINGSITFDSEINKGVKINIEFPK
uniref:tetratricopeptide repeat-containing sensor histidine kinase n=1 Tax=Flavobacterium sp. TaxID=239 RepID=UPI0040477BEF